MNSSHPRQSSSSRGRRRPRHVNDTPSYNPPAVPPSFFQSGWFAPPQPVTFPQGYSGQFWTPNYQAYGFPPPVPPPFHQHHGQMNNSYGFAQRSQGNHLSQSSSSSLQHTYQFGSHQNIFWDPVSHPGMPPPPPQTHPHASSPANARRIIEEHQVEQKATGQVDNSAGVGVVPIKKGKKKKAKKKELKAQQEKTQGAEAQMQPVTQKKSKSRDPKLHLPPPLPPPGYFKHALEPCHAVHPPPNCLIVLDLNGTLIHRPTRRRPTHLIARPYLKPFLRFLFENFSVMVWSSARPENVKVIVENVLDDELRSLLLASWGRDSFGLTPAHYNMNVQVYKDLTKIWNSEDIQRKNPGNASGDRFGQYNTILLDDSRVKAEPQPHNLVEIPEFEATPEQMKSDILREVAGYLETARIQSNVSSFIRQNPFKADGRWNYDWPDELADASETKGGEVNEPVSWDEQDRASSEEQNSEGGVSLQPPTDDDRTHAPGQPQAQWTCIN